MKGNRPGMCRPSSLSAWASAGLSPPANMWCRSSSINPDSAGPTAWASFERHVSASLQKPRRLFTLRPSLTRAMMRSRSGTILSPTATPRSPRATNAVARRLSRPRLLSRCARHVPR